MNLSSFLKIFANNARKKQLPLISKSIILKEETSQLTLDLTINNYKKQFSFKKTRSGFFWPVSKFMDLFYKKGFHTRDCSFNGKINNQKRKQVD